MARTNLGRGFRTRGRGARGRSRCPLGPLLGPRSSDEKNIRKVLRLPRLYSAAARGKPASSASWSWPRKAASWRIRGEVRASGSATDRAAARASATTRSSIMRPCGTFAELPPEAERGQPPRPGRDQAPLPRSEKGPVRGAGGAAARRKRRDRGLCTHFGAVSAPTVIRSLISIKDLLADSLDLHDLLDPLEVPVLGPEIDDPLGDLGADPRQGFSSEAGAVLMLTLAFGAVDWAWTTRAKAR